MRNDTMKARVIRLRPNSGGHGTQVRVSTTVRIILAIQAIGDPWFEAYGFCVIKKRCVTVRRPRGWESWVYFEGKS